MSGFAMCGHCGCYHIGPCPRVRAIEYYPNGTVKRVEYHGAPQVTSGPVTISPFVVDDNPNRPKTT